MFRDIRVVGGIQGIDGGAEAVEVEPGVAAAREERDVPRTRSVGDLIVAAQLEIHA